MIVTVVVVVAGTVRPPPSGPSLPQAVGFSNDQDVSLVQRGFHGRSMDATQREQIVVT
jgi:hypothetical protein